MASLTKVFFLKSSDILPWLESLISGYRVFAPAENPGPGKKPDFVYKRLSYPEGFVFNPYRTADPLKSFFTPYIEKVSDYFSPEFSPEPKREVEGDCLIFGIKACDLAAHRVQDYVFLQGGEEDPFYRAKRDNIIMVSSDCPDFKDVCFCLAMGGKPYPESGFDLNMSPLGGKGYLVETGSVKGDELIEKNKNFFSFASEALMVERENDRIESVDRLNAHLNPQALAGYDSLQTAVEGSLDGESWDKFALTCVECGGCNFICDTCHCFLLSDKKADGGNRRMRLWDSCQYKKFAAVAGSSGPMKSRGERLRNRFLKKFSFFTRNMGVPACCGCGRCIEVCPGMIDIREVLKEISL